MYTCTVSFHPYYCFPFASLTLQTCLCFASFPFFLSCTQITWRHEKSKRSYFQRMDLGECSKVHDLALRADYESASKTKDYFYDVDVSFIISINLIFLFAW